MAQKPTPDAGKRSNPVAGASLQAGTNTDATDASYQDQRGNGGEGQDRDAESFNPVEVVAQEGGDEHGGDDDEQVYPRPQPPRRPGRCGSPHAETRCRLEPRLRRPSPPPVALRVVVCG